MVQSVRCCFHSQMNDIAADSLNSANGSNSSSLQAVQPPSTATAESASLVAGLERRVLQHEDHLRRLDADVEEDASAILANQNRDLARQKQNLASCLA